MKKLTIICISFLLLLNVSCRKVDEAPAQTINAFGFTTFEEAEKNLGQYAKAFYVVDGSIFTRLENYSANNSSIGIVGAWFKDIFNKDRTNGGTYYLGDVEYYYDEAKQAYMARGFENDTDHSQMSARVKRMYGKQIEAKLIRDGKEIFKNSYYVPFDFDLVVSNPILPSTSFYQVSKDKGLILKWRKDEKNKEGVIIYVQWSDDKLDLPPNERYIQIATKIEDTGEVTLPHSFFSKIPKNAIFSVDIIRGNIEILEGTDKKQYKVYNQVENKLNCVIE